MSRSRKIVGILLIIAMLGVYSPLLMDSGTETTYVQLNTTLNIEEQIANAWRSSGNMMTILKMFRDSNDPYIREMAKEEIAEVLYEKLTLDDIWGLVKVARGEKPTESLTKKLSAIGIKAIGPADAKALLQTMDISADRDPEVVMLKYGYYINFKNQPWKMEHWLTTLTRFDKDMDKIADELERIIKTKDPEDILEIHVVPAEGDVYGGVKVFESLGGRIIKIWSDINAIYGAIQVKNIPILAEMREIGFIELHHTNFQLRLRVSIPQQRIGTNDDKYVTTANYPAIQVTPWYKGYKGDVYSTVVLCDTGLDDTHPELYGYQDQGFGSAKIVYWHDTSGTYPNSPGDGHGHGSHCGGIVGGQGNANNPWGQYAMQGVAPEVSLGGIKIFDDAGGFTDTSYTFADYMLTDRDAYHIIVGSHSWGGPDDAVLDEKVNTLVQNGIVQVVAAGNDGYGGNIGSPGMADLVITVGAVNDLNEMTEYTTSGDTTTGNTVKPDVTANGGSGWYSEHTFDTTDYDGNGYIGQIVSVDSNDADRVTGDDNYWEIPGTSMATPHVSGLAALIIDALGGWASWNKTLEMALFVKMVICMTAVEFTKAESPTDVPAPPLNRGGKDNIEGYGRINADAAIMAFTNKLELGEVYTYSLGSGSTSDADQAWAPRAWAGYVIMEAGKAYKLYLDTPSTGDFDIYLYSWLPDEYGQPVILSSSTGSTIGGDEYIEYTPSSTGKYIVVVKWVDRSSDGIADYNNYGQFKFIISEKKNIGIHHYSLPSNAGQYYGIYNNSAITTKVFFRIHNNAGSISGDVSLVYIMRLVVYQ